MRCRKVAVRNVRCVPVGSSRLALNAVGVGGHAENQIAAPPVAMAPGIDFQRQMRGGSFANAVANTALGDYTLIGRRCPARHANVRMPQVALIADSLSLHSSQIQSLLRRVSGGIPDVDPCSSCGPSDHRNRAQESNGLIDTTREGGLSLRGVPSRLAPCIRHECGGAGMFFPRSISF